ncbi:MAG TPA: esterase family protein [Sellimonas intestinalis]|nr:esterase family protein [Sellimonas intestinalis]
MAFFTGNIRSKALRMDTQLQVIIPQDGKFYKDEGKDPCLLILLHGLSDNASVWSRYSAVERYAEQYNVLIAMPEVQRSFYWNMKYGLNYEDYIAEELPELMKKLFHVSCRREDTIIAGLSMGGYGAMRCAFRHPDTFGKCASFSGVIWPMEVEMDDYQKAQSGDMDQDILAIFGEGTSIPEDFSIPVILEGAEEKHKIPQLFVTCGTEDFLCGQNQNFHRFLEEKNIDHKFLQWPGIHGWKFWDRSVELMLEEFVK